jgi:hypothetical protein
MAWQAPARPRRQPQGRRQGSRGRRERAAGRWHRLRTGTGTAPHRTAPHRTAPHRCHQLRTTRDHVSLSSRLGLCRGYKARYMQDTSTHVYTTLHSRALGASSSLVDSDGLALGLGAMQRQRTACLAVLALLVARTSAMVELQFETFSSRVPACRRSGEGAYCSHGLMKGPAYVGYLDTPEELRQALTAATFKKELIVFGENRFVMAAHQVSRIRDLGGAESAPALHGLRDRPVFRECRSCCLCPAQGMGTSSLTVLTSRCAIG